MQNGEKVKLLKPKEAYLHIALDDSLGPPFHECEAFFTESIF